jgi:mono/diheme cytochrome c family protein
MQLSRNPMKGKFQYLWVLALPAVMASCGRAPESTGIEYAPQMYHTIALEPFTQIQDSIAPFKDGMNAQASVPGTIFRGGWADYPYAADDTLGHKSQINPLPWNDQVKAEGEVLYTRYCGICHGKGGAGDGKVSEKDEINPPSFLEEKFKNYTSGQFYHTIMFGKNAMGSYASQLTYEERWKVVHYVEELQGKHAAPTDTTVAAPADSAAAAAALAKEKQPEAGNAPGSPKPAPKPDAKGGKSSGH